MSWQTDARHRTVIPTAGCTQNITSLTINKHRHKSAAGMAQLDVLAPDLYHLGTSTNLLHLTKDTSLQLNTFWCLHTNSCLHSCNSTLHCNSGSVSPQTEFSSLSWGSSIYCLSGSRGSHLFSHPSSSTYIFHRLLYFDVFARVSAFATSRTVGEC